MSRKRYGTLLCALGFWGCFVVPALANPEPASTIEALGATAVTAETKVGTETITDTIGIGGAGVPPVAASVTAPDCTAVEAWPTAMALNHMKNAGLISADNLAKSKTQTVRLASEHIPSKDGLDRDRFMQVHYITVEEPFGRVIELIALNKASQSECSMSGVEVYVISMRMGNL